MRRVGVGFEGSGRRRRFAAFARPSDGREKRSQTARRDHPLDHQRFGTLNADLVDHLVFEKAGHAWHEFVFRAIDDNAAVPRETGQNFDIGLVGMGWTCAPGAMVRNPIDRPS